MKKKWLIMFYSLLLGFIGFGQKDYYSKYHPENLKTPELKEFEKKLEDLMMVEGKLRIQELQTEYQIAQRYINGGCISPIQAEIYGDNLRDWELNLEQFATFSDSLKTNFVLKLKTINTYKEYFLKGKSNEYFKGFLIGKYHSSVVSFPKSQRCFRASDYAMY